MRRKIRSSLCATVILLAISAGASHGDINSFVEDFTTTVYKDTVNTTADWNTVDGELKLFPFSPSLVGSYDTFRAHEVFVDGDFAFVADDQTGLLIVDISDPASPALLGTYNTPGFAFDVFVAGDLAYVADFASGLQVIDITNPASPTLIGSYNTPGNASEVFVAGDHAFVADGISQLVVIDISNPASPTLAGTYTASTIVTGVFVDGDHAFVTDLASGLLVLDISNSASPALLGTYNTPGNAEGVFVDGNHAFVTDRASGLHVIDITNPASPTLMGTYVTSGDATGVFVSGDRAYVANDVSGLAVIDISNPANPVLLHSYDTPNDANGVVVAGDLAFVADQFAGIQVIRVSHPVNPTLVGASDTPGNGFGAVVSGDHAYMAAGTGGIQVIDFTDPTNPTPVGSNNTYAALRVFVSGNLAFAAGTSDGLQVFDVSDPTNPTLLGTNDAVYALDVFVDGDHAFVAGGNAGLHVLDISNPASPTVVGSYDTRYANSVFVDGDYAFVADQDTALHVIDISNPAIPTRTGSYATFGGLPQSVVVSGDHAYVVGLSLGLLVIDISNPASPTLAGSHSTSGASYRAVVDGDYAFVTIGSGGLEVIDISDPANPTPIGVYSASGLARDVFVTGDYAIVSNDFTDFRVIRVFQSEVNVVDNIGRSVAIDTSDPIARARLSTTQTAGVDWEVSADAGTNWQVIPPDGSWTFFPAPGDQLRWRSTHTWEGENPTVSDLQIEWLNDYALIASVNDIPNDQGKQVRVEWTRSGHDFVGDATQIVEYAVYREVGPGFAAASVPVAARSLDDLSPAARENALIMQASGWDFLVAVPVLVEDDYSVVVPTLADSTIVAGDYYTSYRVTALTATPGVFFHSPPDSGYSVDNLAPSVPASFLIAYNTGSGNTLSWDESPDADFQYFSVYRSTDPNFTPAPADRVHSTTSTGWVDPDHDGGAVYYKVTATDLSGNEGDPASTSSVTSVTEDTAPDRWALHDNVPNPFNPTTEIRYSVPAGGGVVSLRIYDVRGRLIRDLVSGQGAPGERSVTWNGRDDRGQAVSSGVYFYRLTASGVAMTKKMVLTK